MASTIQFVDSITATPTVRLDLNNRALGFLLGASDIDMSPPSMRRAVASTLLTDGEWVAGGAYDNRVIRFPIQLVASSAEAAATILQDLGQELDRPRNILKVQLQGMTAPVFFRTYRAPDYTLSMRRLLVERTAVTLEIPAEPFGYGLLETPINAVTFNRDPAQATFPTYIDVTGVKGDVETPALIKWLNGSVVASRESVLAVRRRGTPSLAPWLFQAEAMTQGTDTTTQVNDANFSGAGNNYSRCTFANASMQTRLSVTDIGTAGIDLRGRYHVYLRYRKNTSSNVIPIQLVWGTSGGTTTTNTAFTTPVTTNICIADLGEIQIPRGWDPVYDGRSGVELPVSDTYFLAVQAARTSGADTLDLDFLRLVPADDSLGIVKWVEAPSGADHWWLDADNNSAHARDSSGQAISAAPAGIVSGLPYLSPNQTNRVHILHETAAALAYALTTQTISISYYPRYLYVRPATT